MEKTLVLLSGLPGCGKTTLGRRLAARLGVPLFAKDRVQRVLRDHVPAASGSDSYYLLFDQAEEQLSLGLSVILDAVFPLQEFRALAGQIAEWHGAALRAIHCYCSSEDLWRARVADRTQYVPGWPPADWAEVERVRAYFQPWRPQDALFVDASDPLDRNFERVLQYVDAGRFVNA